MPYVVEIVLTKKIPLCLCLVGMKWLREVDLINRTLTFERDESVIL